MQITIFGASGRVGQLVTKEALGRGYTVTAFVHNNDPFEAHLRLSVIKGDIADSSAVSNALKNSHAVISALGSWKTKDKNIVSSGMQAIIPAMGQYGITRLITLTGTGALWSGDTPSLMDKAARRLLILVAPKILHDGEAHLRLLEASQLNWTCVRSPAMNNRGSARYKLNLQQPLIIKTVSRQAVADSLLDLAEQENFTRAAPIIHRV